MNFFSIRTNDQNTIGQILDKVSPIIFDRLTWHKEEISIGDIIFIVISGDSSKKKYIYDNGLRAIGKVKTLPKDETGDKQFNLEVDVFEFLPKTLMKEDFYVYPSLKDAPNIGPETKQAPNQAFRKIDEIVGKSIIRALFDILPEYLKKSNYNYNSIIDNDYRVVKLSLNIKDEEDIKKDFYNFLKSNGRIETTAKQYISKLTELGNWLTSNNIIKSKFNIWTDKNEIEFINEKLNTEFKELWLATNKSIKNWYSSPWNAWYTFNSGKETEKIIIENEKFNINIFSSILKSSGLIFSPQLIQRFVASLCTKPFVICSGLSGSGKTKLAQAFVQWITSDKSQYVIVPVGADWTNREPLLGYPNALNKEEYVSPENGVLDLMVRAKQNIENTEEPTKPYFLILDEMNLSHVERYFADFLSTMESGDTIPLHKILPEPTKDLITIPQTLKLPKNLFIIGTVNIDETTYMFSPKVLDRANTIEFRLTEEDLKKFIASDIKLNMDLLKAQGVNMSESFMEMALLETNNNLKSSEADFILFFSELKKSGAEFGYRTASEIGRLMYMLKELGESGDNLLDIAIMQKLLPKLHGSRNKLTKVLPILGGFCLKDNSKIKEDYLDKFQNNNLTELELKSDANIKYKISFEKICRMYKNAVENGFASYAEA
jgi:5-methylcytosine-specific restriction protein B